MTDKELADKVIALGIGRVLEESDWINEKGDYAIGGNSGNAKWFVRDWRVAGVLIERYETPIIVHRAEQNYRVHSPDVINVEVKIIQTSLPRAIIEAYVEALSD